MNFTNKENCLTINEGKMNINYNGAEKKIVEIYFINSSKGMLETIEYIIKFSKNILNIFDKGTNELLDTLTFNESFVVPDKFNINSLENNTSNILMSFVLRLDHIINLYKYITNGVENFQVSILKKGNVILTEDIISKISNGSDIIYTTKSGNILVVGTIRNSKWNGSPIGIKQLL